MIDDVKVINKEEMQHNKKYTLTLTDIFNNPIIKHVTFLGFFENGYNLPSGAWSLNKISDDAKKALFVFYIPKRCRKKRSINIDDIDLVVEGWT